MDQPVVRHRLAKCGALLESQSAWIEQFVYQLTKMDKGEADQELGGMTGLCKANAGIVLDECARCAVLLFGGNGYTRTGQGEIAESKLPFINCEDLRRRANRNFFCVEIYREVPGARIPGGSEDVMLDMAIRQLVKRFKSNGDNQSKTSRI